MKQEIVVPRMGESISEATIGTILKSSGSFVQADDEILELETDKVNQVLYAPVAGKLHLTVQPQQTVKIGETIGFVDSEVKEDASHPAKKGEESQPSQKDEKKEFPAPKEPVQVQKEVRKQPSASVSRKTKDAYLEDLKSKEKQKPKAEEKPAAVAEGKQPESAEERVPGKIGERSESRKKLSRIRRVIAERMLQAQATTASLTTFNEVDLTQVIMVRDRYKDSYQKEYGVKLGLMSFFVKASVSSLKEYPEVNAYLDGDDLVYREYFDVGIAVSTDRGVIVPVLRNCDQLTFAEIEQGIDAFAQQARQGTVSYDDLQGAGFTITNGGVFGSLLSTPILTPPQTGILGMHKIVKRPVAIGDQILIRPMMYLALTYDHRVIDGREAVSFLVHIKQCLEDPSRLLIEI